jgi:hypothetical protein
VALASLAVVGVATGCPIPPPPTTPLPVPAPGPCDPATMRCPRDLTSRLRALGLGGAEVQAVSSDGEIVGSGSFTAGLPDDVGFRLSADGSGRLLPQPAGALTIVDAVNAGGLVAGALADQLLRPAAWDDQSRLIDLTPKLPTLGGWFRGGEAYDVNESGQVAGSYTVDLVPPGTQADVPRVVWVVFVWDARTDAVTVVDSGPVDGAYPSSSPTTVGIADDGVVASSLLSVPATGEQVVRWVPRPDGGHRREVLGRGAFVAVSAAGAVLAMQTPLVPGAERPAVWVAGSGMRLLPAPPGWTPTSAFIFWASDINERGEVVGTYSNGGNAQRPLRWPAGASVPPELLETDGGTRVTAEAINAAGAIVGTATVSDPAPAPTGLLSVVRRPLLWDPVP